MHVESSSFGRRVVILRIQEISGAPLQQLHECVREDLPRASEVKPVTCNYCRSCGAELRQKSRRAAEFPETVAKRRQQRRSHHNYSGGVGG